MVKKMIKKGISILFFIESLVVAADLYNRQLFSKGDFSSVIFLFHSLLLFVFLLMVFFAASLLLHPPFSRVVFGKVERVLETPSWRFIILVVCTLLMVETIQDLIFLRADLEPVHYQGYRQLLGDYFTLLLWVLLVSLQGLVLVVTQLWDRFSIWVEGLWTRQNRAVLLGTLLLLGFLLQSVLGSFEGIQEYLGFTEVNTPLLGLQVWGLSILIFFLLILLGHVKWKTRLICTRRELILMVLIGMIAYLSWIGVPPGAKSFTDSARPPNFGHYPTSDAVYYERAGQQVLVGNGVPNNNHIGFIYYLAALHAVAGDGITQSLAIHLGILSLMPVFLYLLTATMHTRFSGLLVSLLFIIRVRTSLVLGEHITVSAVNDFMTEPMTTLTVILFSTLLVVWLQRSPQKQHLLLLAGGVMGLAFLIRIEVATMIAGIALALFFFFEKNLRLWIQAMVLFGIGMVLLIGPWMIYGIAQTGSVDFIFLEEGNRFAGAVNSYSAQVAGDTPDKGRDLHDRFPHHVAQSLKQQILYLPSNHQPLLTFENLPDLVTNPVDPTDLEGDRFSEKYLERYVRGLPYWWNDWDGRIVPRSYIPLAFTVFLVVVGFAQLHGKKRWYGALLIFLSIAHSFIYAFIGKSGGRFITIVDWIPQVFYGIGISYLLSQLGKSFDWIAIPECWVSEKQITAGEGQIFRPVNPSLILIGGFLLLVGSAFPIAEVSIPQAYTQEGKEQVLGQVAEQLPSIEAGEAGQDVIYGKALYPRYFKGNSRMEDDRDGTIPDYSYERVEFFLVGTDNLWITLPGKEGKKYFPHGRDVLVFGTRQPEYRDSTGERVYGEYLKADQIVILGDGPEQGKPVVLNCTGKVCGP